MRRFMFPMIALALAFAPALHAQTAGAQRGQAPERAGRAMNPAAHALAHRAELGLTAEQVTRLESIQTRLDTENRPLLEQVRSARAESREERGARRAQREEARERMRKRLEEMTPEQRAELRQRMEERRAQSGREGRPEGQRPRAEARRWMSSEQAAALRPVMEQLRENHRAARSEVQAVLSEDQQTKLRELTQQRMTELRARFGEQRRARAAPRR